ncbi:CAP domain-containing protein [Phormidesmis sp. 146-35]
MNLTQYWSGAGVVASLISIALISPTTAQVTARKSGGEVCQKQKVLLAAACDGDDLEPEEAKLHQLVNQYRAQHNLPPIPLSKSLTLVANRHAQDLAENLDKLTHSWSNCAFDAHDAQTYPCMWSAPQRLKTAYPSYGFENAYISYGENVTAEKAFKGWQDHTAHNDVMLNQERWKAMKWNAVGVAVYKHYAVMWFGQDTDPAGLPTKIETVSIKRSGQ